MLPPSEPIAVVGMSCNFPANSTNPEKLWDLISQGRSAWSEIPKDRFNVDAFYHPSGERDGTIIARGGHFLKSDITSFDAPFFSITPSEARAMDPQQRLLLESVYEALENAGTKMEDIVGSDTACFVGCFTKDYAEMFGRDPEKILRYQATGIGQSILANRISWFYDLTGPSVTLDTACSSSLVSVHLACQSLRSGESKMAIVGGTNLLFSPDMMISMTALHFLSPTSTCKTFDESADGYARGEGVAAVILKPLANAVQDGDVIRAVIRGTAVNQDGKTAGITLPSSNAQKSLIRRAYSNAGILEMMTTGYFEAHGTGTAAGDPLEAEAISSTLAKGREPGNPLLVGSVKTNIGHLEGCSGLAGLIKTVLSLEKGMIAPNLYFKKANPRIPMEEWNIKVPTKLTAWPAPGLRRASVNSFGYGGTNAHAVLDDAYHYLLEHGMDGKHRTVKSTATPVSAMSSISMTGDYPKSRRQTRSMNSASKNNSGAVSNGECNGDSAIVSNSNANGAQKFLTASARRRLYVWSYHEESAAKRYATHMLEYLRGRCVDEEETFLRDLSYTLAERRSRLQWKTYCTASSISSLMEKLSEGIVSPNSSPEIPTLGFVFTGQGAQWYAMGRELFAAFAHYRETILAADKYFKMVLRAPWSLLEELHCDEKSSRINEAEISQPLCTVVQTALVGLLKSWNITPAAVIGHSSGEIAAAYCAGGLTLESAWEVSYYRGVLSSSVKNRVGRPGSMMAVGVSTENIQPYLSRVSKEAGKAVVACINSPRSITVSGDDAAVEELQQLLSSENIFARKLKVETAYHSHHMAVIADEYLQSLQSISRGLDSNIPAVRMFSTVTGKEIGVDQMGPEYWVKNMISSVQFCEGLGALCTALSKANGIDLLLELGPHAALQGPIKQILQQPTLKGTKIGYLSALRRNNDALETMLDLAGAVFAKGYPIDIDKVNDNGGDEPAKATPLVDLPPFPFNHSVGYWFESRLSTAYRHRNAPRKDLLGATVPDYNPREPRWRNFIRISENPWVADHKVQFRILYPAAGYIVMAIEAAFELATQDGTKKPISYTVRDCCITRALIVPRGTEGVETALHMRPYKTSSRSSSPNWNEFCLFSYTSEAGWTEHCRGLISVETEDIDETVYKRSHNLASTTPPTTSAFPLAIEPKQIYEKLETLGLQYGLCFRNLSSIRVGKEGESFSEVTIPNTKQTMPKNFEYPYIIHPATLDNIFQMTFGGLVTNMKEPMIPTFIQELTISHGIEREAGSKLFGHVQTHRKGLRQAVANMTVWDGPEAQLPQNTSPKLVISGFECTALAPANEPNFQSANDVRKLCFNFEWKEDIELLRKEQAHKIFSVARASVASVSNATIDEMEIAAFSFIHQTLNKVNFETLIDHHHKLFYQWMQDVYNRARKGRFVRVKFDEVTSMSSDVLSTLYGRVEKASNDGKLMCRLGKHLQQLFAKELVPLELMVEGNLLYKYYEHAIGLDQSYAQIAAYMNLLSHKRPDLEILEIGAGTGGTSLPTLNVLGGYDKKARRFASYTFTDISAGFFEKAQEKFKSWGEFIKYQILNIEQDPTTQGFQPGSYDVIIAANVLHATSNIERTLRNVRKLLRPGGKLILLEITQLLLSTSMIFGNLPGWWMGDADGRKGGPTMSESRWNMLLSDLDFTGLDICVRDTDNPDMYSMSVMISTAKDSEAPSLASAIALWPEIVVVISEEYYQWDLARQFQRSGVMYTSEGSPAFPVTTIMTLHEVQHLDLKGKAVVFLCEVDASSLLADAQHEDYTAVQHIISTAIGVLWVTKGGVMSSSRPEQSLVVGLARCVRSENYALTFITLDLDAETPLAVHDAADRIAQVYFHTFQSHKLGTPQDSEFAERLGVLYTNRITEARYMNEKLAEDSADPAPVVQPIVQQGRPLQLKIDQAGLLDTLTFHDDPAPLRPLYPHEVEIEVKATGLNFRDVAVALGQIADELLGCECSGVVTAVGSAVTKLKEGDRVYSYRFGCYQNYVREHEDLVRVFPENMSFEEAASLPLVFSTAYYSLIEISRLQAGETVLIHTGAGGVGQAALVLCKMVGANPYVTVGSQEKKEFLIKEYSLPEEHILFSRDTSFAKEIMKLTNNKGVDIVLNTLSGEGLRESWKCVAAFGRFCDLTKKDIEENGRLDLRPFERNVSFHSIDLRFIYAEHKTLAARIFEKVDGLFHQKIITGIKPVTVYSYSKIEEAFRLMQSGKSIGKIVVKLHLDDSARCKPPTLVGCHFNPNASYLLVGGLGGLGRSTARWLGGCGAQNIIFLSRSANNSNKASKEIIEELKDMGVNVSCFSCDISNGKQLKEVLKRVKQTLPPIKGVIQGAMVLKDLVFERMSLPDFRLAITPKVQGSWNLHKYLPKDLDFFVMLSSSAGIAGNQTQSNYSAANTFQDALTHYRIARGLHSVTLDLGMILGVGFLAENKESIENLKKWGFLGIHETEFHSLLDWAIRTPLEDLTATSCQVITGLGTQGMMEKNDSENPFWFRDPKFAHLRQMDSASKFDDEHLAVASLKDRLAEKQTVEEARMLVQEELMQKLAKLLMISVENIDARKPMHAYGVDSLVAAEIKNWIFRDFRADVPTFEVLGSNSIMILASKVVVQSAIVPQSLKEEKEG